MSEQRGNQAKDEPIATTPQESPQSSDSGDAKPVEDPLVKEATSDGRTTALAPPGKPDGEVDTRT